MAEIADTVTVLLTDLEHTANQSKETHPASAYPAIWAAD
jgi:hypothetical protein